jgi:hypothetical protein
MSDPASPLAHLTPLLDSKRGNGHGTTKPRLCLVIPPPCLAPIIAARDYIAVDIAALKATLAESSVSSSCRTSATFSTHCDYCRRNNLLHDLVDDDRGLWARCVNDERSLAVIEFMITLQIRLLAIMIPSLMLFVLYAWLTSN